MIQYAHLEPDVVECMDLSDPERIEFCNDDRWVGYTAATGVLAQLDELVTYPRSLRMPNVLVVGRSGNGKSSIVQEFCNRHPVEIAAAGSPIAPVLSIEMPENATESEFWSAILWTLGISHREKDSPSIKKREAYSGLEYARVKVLVMDEFNNLTNAGKHASAILGAIKGLSNRLKVSIVAAGTQTAINALNHDPQMKSRFEPAVLERWQLNKEFLRFLASYEQLLPLARPSNLASREIAPRIYALGGDTIGNIVKVLKKSSVEAIKSGEERITLKVLDSIDWVRADQWDDVAKRV